MLLDKLTLTFGLILVYFVLSTNCNSSEESTAISSIVEDMKDFLERVKGLDIELELPKKAEKLDKIRTHIWSGWYIGRSVKNKEKYFERFIHRYKKFVDISYDCIDDYLKQIRDIANNSHRNIGVQDTRADFITYYDYTFIQKMKPKGYKHSEIETAYLKLYNKLTELRNTIINQIDAPPPPPPQPEPVPMVQYVVVHHHSGSSSSQSHDGENGERIHKKNKHKEGEVYHEEKNHSKSKSDHSGHGTGDLLLAAGAGAAVGVGGTLLAQELMENSEEGHAQEAPPQTLPPPPPAPAPEVEDEPPQSSSSQYEEEDFDNGSG